MQTQKLSEINATISKYRWTICSLLFFATTINYLDRQVLSLLKSDLEVTFGWNDVDYGNITSFFQFTYAISLLFAGRFIDWLGTKKGYAWAIIIWSAGAMGHALSRGTGGFMLWRGILGFGESGNFPAAIKTTAEWFPKKDRALATGIFNSGSNIGAILAPLTVPFIAAYWGWQMAFIIVGSIGFIWLIFWLLLYDTPQKMLEKGKITQGEFNYIHSDKEDAVKVVEEKNALPWHVEWGKLLTYKQTWAFTIGKFMTDGVWWFFLFWLPDFLKTQYGMTTPQMAIPLAVLYSMTMVGSIGGGAFPMYFINKGMNPYAGRMKAMLIIALFPLVVLATQYMGGYSFWWAIVLIGIGASAHQAWSANIFTTVSDMFPKKVVGSVTGIGGMAGGVGGIVISQVAGHLFKFYDELGQKETGYTLMFLFCAVAYLLAWAIMKSLVPKFKPVSL
ncbi:hexuronate transporter [Bacteroidia bacterium]|nr:hexuronate transporter [Bacteroidia bacterium]